MIITTIKTTTYQCETCRTVYKYKAGCEFCEDSPALPACKYQVGQTVSFETRYDGIKSAQIESIEVAIKSDSYKTTLESWEENLCGLQEVFGRVHPDSSPEEAAKHRQSHCYLLTLDQEFQFGKGYWSNQIADYNVVETLA